MLFADVKGSMDLAEQVDPEEWHTIMDRFFAILSEGVHRFEGTSTSTQATASWRCSARRSRTRTTRSGPATRRSHLRDELAATRRAARRSAASNFSVRMGLNSGEVVVGKIGDDLRMDYTAQGHTVGLAARMEQLAEPGSICLTEHTAKLVRGYFALRDLGESRIKGVAGSRRPVHRSSPLACWCWRAG